MNSRERTAKGCPCVDNTHNARQDWLARRNSQHPVNAIDFAVQLKGPDVYETPLITLIGIITNHFLFEQKSESASSDYGEISTPFAFRILLKNKS